MSITEFNISLLEDMLNAIKDYGIYMISPEGIIHSWNQGAERIKGFKPEEIIGKNFSMLYPEEDRKNGKPQKLLDAALKQGTIEDIGWRLRKDGSKFWADVIITPIYDKQGKHIGFSKVTRDISESLKTDELHDILDSLEVLAWVAAPDGAIIYYNKRWKKFIGNGNIPANQLTTVVHPEDRERTTAKWSQAVESGKKHLIEHRFLDGEMKVHWMHTSAVPIKDELGEIYMWVGSSLEITDQKKLLHAKDEMIDFTAHELKTPLTTIKAYVELLKRCKEQGKECDEHDYLEKTHILIDRLANLVSEMNEITKIEVGKLKLKQEAFSLDKMVSELASLLQETNTAHRIEVQADGEVKVCADRKRIEQVLTNYISNAIKYSPQQSQVEVEIKAQNGFAVVAVKDHGIGIPKKEQKSIFQKFRRANNTGKIEGLGLGLYLCKQLIEPQGGEVWFESEENVGSTFYFSLPLYSEAE